MHRVKNQVKKHKLLGINDHETNTVGIFSMLVDNLAMNGNILTIFLLKTNVNKDRSTKLDFATTTLGLEIAHLNAKRLVLFKPLKISL